MSALRPILLPAFAKGMEAARLARWAAPAGGWIAEGDVLAEIETDKATMEIEAPADGVLVDRLVEPGPAMLPVGIVLGHFAPGGRPAPGAPAAESGLRLPPALEPSGPCAELAMEPALTMRLGETMRDAPDRLAVLAPGAFPLLRRALAQEFPERVLIAPEDPAAALDLALGVAAAPASVLLTLSNPGALAPDRLAQAAARLSARGVPSLIVAAVGVGAVAAFPKMAAIFAPVGPGRLDAALSGARAPGLSVLLIETSDETPAPTPLRPIEEPAGPRLARAGAGPVILAFGPGLAAAKSALERPACARLDPALIDLERLDLDPAALAPMLARAGAGLVVDPWPGLGYGQEWANALTAAAFERLARPVAAVAAAPDAVAAGLARAGESRNPVELK